MSKQKPLVFIVDDNEYTLLQIRKSLQQVMACEVLGFKKATDCLMNLHMNPDFILSDYNLTDETEGGMNGEQLLVLLKARRPDLPVMMYSSRNSVALAVRLMKKGATDFVNSDSVSHTSLFATKIATLIKKEKERLHKHGLERQLFWVLIALCVVFVSTITLLAAFAPAALPYSVIGFLLLFGSLVFLGNPSIISQFFPGKKKTKHVLDHPAKEHVS